MSNNIPSSKESGGGLLILEADHKLAERKLFEGTKNIQQSVNKRITGG